MLKKWIFISSIILVFFFTIYGASASDIVSANLMGDDAVNNDFVGYVSAIGDMRYSSSEEPSNIGDSINANDGHYALSVDDSETVFQDLADMDEDNSIKSSDDKSLGSDDSTVVKTEGNTFDDIQEAIDKAKDNGVIELNGTYCTDSNKTITVNKSLTFEGHGLTVLDAKTNVSFDAQDNIDSLVIKNIIFKNFHMVSSWDYGSIAFTCNRLSIINCSFITDGLERGFVHCYAHNISIRDSNFINERLELYGMDFTIQNSNLDNVNLSLFNNGKSSSISNSNFSCSAIDVDNSNGIIIMNSIFYNKSAIDLFSNAKLINCNFKNNNNGNLTTIHKYYSSALSITNNNKTISYDKNNNFIILDSFKSYKLWDVKPVKTVVAYNSGEKLSFKIYHGYLKKSLASGMKVNIELRRGNKVWSYALSYGSDMFKTNKNGHIILKTSLLKVTFDKSFNVYNIYNSKKGKTNLVPGNYKISINNLNDIGLSDLDYRDHLFQYNGVIKIKKASTFVKAPKITVKSKRNKYFKVTLKHKSNKKALSGVKVKLRIYTGKKYKTYTVKTNQKGVALFNTKKLKKGVHKVKIYSGNKYYNISKNSRIKIK